MSKNEFPNIINKSVNKSAEKPNINLYSSTESNKKDNNNYYHENISLKSQIKLLNNELKSYKNEIAKMNYELLMKDRTIQDLIENEKTNHHLQDEKLIEVSHIKLDNNSK